eukprot:sb/3478923/
MYCTLITALASAKVTTNSPSRAYQKAVISFSSFVFLSQKWHFARPIFKRYTYSIVPKAINVPGLCIFVCMDRRCFTKFIIVFERKRHKIRNIIVQIV